MTHAVVFDLWSTLAYNDSEKSIIREMFGEIGEEPSYENQKVLEKSFMLRRIETIGEGMKLFCRAFGKSESHVPNLVKLWESPHPKLFDDVIPSLRRLGKKYRLGLITNTQSFLMDFFYKIKFFEEFDYACLSCDVGLLKPDPEIFRLALRKLEVKPGEAVMVGDNLHSDVLGAEAVGMRGVLIKRHKKGLGWKELQKWKRTITSLTELEKFL